MHIIGCTGQKCFFELMLLYGLYVEVFVCTKGLLVF